LKGYQAVHFQSFDAVHKRTEATVKAKDGKTFKVTKGAPQVILHVGQSGQVKSAVDKQSTICGAWLSFVGVARAEGDGQWQFVAYCPCSTAREDAKALSRPRCNGVKSRWYG